MKIHSVTNQNFILWGVSALALLGAFCVGSSIGESSEVPFAVFSNVITCILALMAFISPRTGLSIVVFQAMFTDQFKRIAVAYSTISMDLVITVLIGPLITICAIHASIFMKAVIFRTIRVDRTYWYFQGAIALLTLGMILFGVGNLSVRGQFAANVGLYLSLLPLIELLLPTIEEWRGFMALQILLVLPSAIWGIKQYFFGFTDMEWNYARTGLSQTHSAQMLLFEKPRVFGLLGSASAFGCISLYGVYALWQALIGKKHRLLFLLAGIIMMIAVVLSTQRSMVLIPFIVLASYFLMLSRLRTVVFYVISIALLLLGIIYSQYLLDYGLDIINEIIRSDTEWGSQVLNVNTFSDRLQGWSKFLDSSTWSFFGKGTSSLEEYQHEGGHDLVNKMLLQVGAVGTAAVLLLIASTLTILHRIVWRAPNGELMKEGAFLLACFVPILMMNIMGGGNLNTVPTNLQLWSMLAGVLVFRRQYHINIFKVK